MEESELSAWREGVMEHINTVDTIVNDRKILKTHIKNHLLQFFDFDEWRCNRDFSVITLVWDKDKNPVIRNDKIDELGMDWIIHVGYDAQAFKRVEVTVYPFGIVEEEDD